MDVEPEAARFQAASFLVESMLEQKMRHVNARVGAQEALLRAIDSSDNEVPVSTNTVGTKPAWTATLTSNGRFLLEMVQQVRWGFVSYSNYLHVLSHALHVASI
jgi:hypothetical protein